MMNQFAYVRHNAVTCHWAVQPPALRWPAWFDAETSRWECKRDESAPVLVTISQCADCARWEPRPNSPEDPRR